MHVPRFKCNSFRWQERLMVDEVIISAVSAQNSIPINVSAMTRIRRKQQLGTSCTVLFCFWKFRVKIIFCYYL